MKEETFNFVSDENDEGERVDTVISNRYKFSRSFLKNSLEILLINENKSKLSKKVKKGDKIFFKLKYNEISDKIIPQKGYLNILFEDEYFIILRKQPGIPVHPSAGHYQNTLCNYVMDYLLTNNINLYDAGIVHRLDKDTEGLLIFAKNKNVQEKLRDLFKKRKIKKYYFAICYNNKRQELIKNKVYSFEDFLSRSKENRLKFTTKNKSGKIAQLKFKPIFFFNDYFLANIKLITGRTHQIRVQFSERGFPIVGDIIYNSKNDKYYKTYGLLLFSYKLEFLHPENGNLVRVICSLPKRFKDFILMNLKIEK